jgi:glutamate dehydrogenase (NADP+)
VQAYAEVATSVEPFIQKNPEYAKALEIISIPERVIQFRYVEDVGTYALSNP